MGHGLDDVGVRVHRALEHIGGIPGGAETDHLERRAFSFGPGLEPRKDLLYVLDRVALGELVLLLEDVALLVDDHGLGGSRAAIHADHGAYSAPGGETPRLETGYAVEVAKGGQLGGRACERWTRRIAQLGFAS